MSQLSHGEEVLYLLVWYCHGVMRTGVGFLGVLTGEVSFQ